MVWFSPTDQTGATVTCQTISHDIAAIRVLYAIAKVVQWLEGLVWPP